MLDNTESLKIYFPRISPQTDFNLFSKGIQNAKGFVKSWIGSVLFVRLDSAQELSSIDATLKEYATNAVVNYWLATDLPETVFAVGSTTKRTETFTAAELKHLQVGYYNKSIFWLEKALFTMDVFPDTGIVPYPKHSILVLNKPPQMTLTAYFKTVPFFQEVETELPTAVTDANRQTLQKHVLSSGILKALINGIIDVSDNGIALTTPKEFENLSYNQIEERNTKRKIMMQHYAEIVADFKNDLIKRARTVTAITDNNFITETIVGIGR